MNRFHLPYRVLSLLCIFLISCSSYREIRIEEKFPADFTGRHNPYYAVMYTGTAQLKAGEKFRYYNRIRYVAVKSEDRHLTSILEKSSEEFNKGNHHSAAILLKDAAEIWDKGAAENNLAVFYELTGEKDLAFNMYTRALLRKPENRMFRHNFLSFINRKESAL